MMHPSAPDDQYRILGPGEGLGTPIEAAPSSPPDDLQPVASTEPPALATSIGGTDEYGIARQPPSSDVEIEDVDLDSDPEPVPVPARPSRWVRFAEAIGLSIGMYFFHFAAALAAFLLLAAIHGGGTLAAFRQVAERVESEDSSVHAVLLLFTQSSTLVYACLLAALFFRPGGFRELGWKPPRFIHLVLVAVMALPVGLIGSKVQESILRVWPGSDGGLHEQLQLAVQMPYLLLVYVIAVLPALGEEILFRGVIGRRLGAAFGPVATVLLTTVLFGAIHGNVAQAMAVIPIGLLMHFLYLTTRSLWTPILLHFLNNAMAATMLKFGDGTPMQKLIEGESPIPFNLVVVCGSLITAVCAAIWHTRESSTNDVDPRIERDLADILERIELRAEQDEVRRIGSLIATALVVHCVAFAVCLWLNRPV
jgi:membrane protease YdiL (CAAX protease family)